MKNIEVKYCYSSKINSRIILWRFFFNVSLLGLKMFIFIIVSRISLKVKIFLNVFLLLPIKDTTFYFGIGKPMLYRPSRHLTSQPGSFVLTWYVILFVYYMLLFNALVAVAFDLLISTERFTISWLTSKNLICISLLAQQPGGYQIMPNFTMKWVMFYSRYDQFYNVCLFFCYLFAQDCSWKLFVCFR